MSAEAGMQMEAVRILEYGKPFSYGPVLKPVPGPGEVLIRVAASGLCATDLHIRDGRQDLGELPRIPGHETAGYVDTPGPGVTGWNPGDPVLVALDVTCGRCRHCLTGNTQICPSIRRLGFELDGGHAGYLSVPEPNLIPLPPGLPPEDACILPDAASCMWHALVTHGGIGPRDRTLILGAGGLGLHGVQIARLAGASVMATSRRKARRDAAEELGAVPFDPSTEDMAAAVKDFTNNEGLDIVADCVGTKDSLRQGLSMLRPGGTLLVIAYLDKVLDFESLSFFSRERRIIGCRGTNKAEMAMVIDLTARGLLKPIIGSRYPLSRIADAAEHLDKGDLVGRIVLTRE